jgi:nucleoid-associated protein YgaU
LVRTGDRIDNIAAEEYGDPAKWRPIAEANDLDDPSQLEPGHVLIIPRLN